MVKECKCNLCAALREQVTITKQHAFSLRELVKHYRQMIDVRNKENAPLTIAYCDELLEDLEEGE
jgi:hypothetical protein